MKKRSLVLLLFCMTLCLCAGCKKKEVEVKEYSAQETDASEEQKAESAVDETVSAPDETDGVEELETSDENAWETSDGWD